MQNSFGTLILVANEQSATLCANNDGVTRLLRSIDRVLPINDTQKNANHANYSPSGRHIYACELMMALGRGATEHDYDGVVIFAEAPMMEELRSVQTRKISRLLIAEIVGVPSEEQCQFRSAANTEIAYREAL